MFRQIAAYSVAVLMLAAAGSAMAADHLDAPAVQADGRTDINDLFAFQSPANPANTVLVLTVNPLAGVASPTAFDEGAAYTFQIDNDGDAAADISYTTTFAAPSGGAQGFSIARNSTAYASGSTGSTTVLGGGAAATAGVFDDPFFFDLAGFQDGLNFTGDDFFAGANVSAIILEVPSSELNGTDSNIGVWATTSAGGTQIDRIGRPAINTVLLGSESKDAFNAASPADDFATFGAEVNAAIAGLSNQANADALTPILLPDVLTFDTASSAGFLNGRRLADDVIDAELTLLTASTTPIGDGVDANDAAFLNVFPYLAAANIPEPATAALLVLSIGGLLGVRSRH